MVGTGPAELAFQATSGLSQLAQQLRAAAEQQGQFQQEMRLRGQDQQLRQDEFANTKDQQGWQRQEQGFGNQLELLRSGARPVGPGGTMPGPATPGGQVLPGMVGVTMNAMDPGQVVTPPGSSQGYYVPTQDENNARETQQKVGLQEALNQANSFAPPNALTGRWEQQLGVPSGTLSGIRIPHEGVGKFISDMVKPDPVAKTVNPHIGTATNDNGDVTTTAYDPTAGKKLWSDTQKGVGPRRKDPDAPGAGQPKPATPTQLNTIENKKRVALARAEAAFKKAMGNAKIGGYTDTEAAGQALTDLHEAKQSSQNAYEQELQQYGVPTQHMEYSDEAGSGAAQPPAQQKQQQQSAAAAPAQQQQKPAAAASRAESAITAAAQKAQVTVMDPKGGKHVFPNQAAADKFKKLAGIQ